MIHLIEGWGYPPQPGLRVGGQDRYMEDPNFLKNKFCQKKVFLPACQFEKYYFTISK